MSVRRIPARPVEDKTGGRIVTITIGADAGSPRLDRALADALSSLPEDAPSRSRLKSLIASGAVSSGGVTISDPSRRVKPGQVFAVSFPDATAPDLAPQEMPLSIVYEDMHLIVIDKPAGLVVHPAPGNPDRTLVNALLAHCGPSLSGIGGVARPGIVHRLDKDTSGLLVAAKTEAAHRHLAEQFAQHTVERVYAAVVWGTPRPREGELIGAIGRSRGDRKKMTVRRDGGGKPALTRYRVVRGLAGGAASLIECRLATGRTHQIRVHLAGAGHPLIGDPVYGRPTRRRSLPPGLAALAEGWTRQALDAFVLGFDHPKSGKKMRFSKEYDKYINMIISKMEEI